jgi:FkbM family methyltransferase
MDWPRLYGRLFARKGFARFNSLLYRCAIRGLGYLNFEDFRATGEDFFVRGFFKSRGPSDSPVIFDIGAHRGEYARLVRGYSPDALIYAFEPHPRSYQELKTLAASHRLVVLNQACGDRVGSAELFDFADRDGSRVASMDRNVFDKHFRRPCRSYRVKTTTIDRFVEDHGIDRIDLLKIDTEGTELNVLRGARQLIRGGCVGAVQFEIGGMTALQRVFLRDFYEELPRHHFYRLLPGGLLPLGTYRSSLEVFHYQNIVALPDRPFASTEKRPVSREETLHPVGVD